MKFAYADPPYLGCCRYHHQGLHNGNLYRFDGWERWQVNRGSSGGGAWSRKRYASDIVLGPKTLWGWRYPIDHRKEGQAS